MPFNSPPETIAKVLQRLGIDPIERIFVGDQDPEYTACRSEELPMYFQLYSDADLAPKERAVLCCFMLECLNEFIQNGTHHALQNEILETLMASEEHSKELAYWMDTSDPDQENWWPITKTLLRHRKSIDSARE
jgi:hypothetical protein